MPNVTVLSEYISKREAVSFYCSVCDDSFISNAGFMAYEAKGCSVCNSRLKQSPEDYAKRLAKVHPSICLAEHYRGFYTPTKHKCLICDNKWSVIPQSLLGLNGCKFCSRGANHSLIALSFMTKLSVMLKLNIRTILNGGEFEIPGTRFKCDGYNAKYKTVFEFYGDRWHGNPNLYLPSLRCGPSHATAGELYTRTRRREQLIRNRGFRLFSVWENDYKRDPDKTVELMAKKFNLTHQRRGV